MTYLRSNRSGQSLTEVLVGTTITALLVVAAVALISPVLRNDKYVSKLATSGALGRELIDNARTFSTANWRNLYNLSTSSANKYYLNTATSPFVAVTGTEIVVFPNGNYTRYFYIDELRRDLATDDITTSTTNSILDPSTLMVTAVVSSPQGPTTTIAQVLTRSQNMVFIQSDWSGGATSSIVSTTSTINNFVSSSNITTTSTPGSIILNVL